MGLRSCRCIKTDLHVLIGHTVLRTIHDDLQGLFQELLRQRLHVRRPRGTEHERLPVRTDLPGDRIQLRQQHEGTRGEGRRGKGRRARVSSAEVRQHTHKRAHGHTLTSTYPFKEVAWPQLGGKKIALRGGGDTEAHFPNPPLPPWPP